CQKYSYSPLTF
nr:immunoglobulin light chain junction region [Macaca mulatta]MOV93323.1 immunoglobulin light chain junction region [Macaca mulatta]